MCGITGMLSTRGLDAGVVQRLTDTIAHRGPDDSGLWIDAEAGVALGHRRLAIVDLSPAGHQPMASIGGRYRLSFNGEIYNHQAIRAQLDAAGCGGGWRGHSDTETLIAAITAWGLEATLARCVGMFAFALWDRRERTLQLVRDRFGEKPLYYGWAGNDFVFGSELNAISAHPAFRGEISRTALRLLMARACVPAPFSIYEHVYKLLPGCILTIDAARPLARPAEPPTVGDGRAGLSLTRYWDYAQVVRAGLDDPVEDEREAVALVDVALADAIRGQAVADVPVGAFLSGGVDSSTVVALYRKHSAGAVRTFSIGFEDEAYNEADHARAVACHLGTDHNELVVSVRETQEVIPLLPTIYDEPFADSSQIPTFLVSRFARQQVTVALSGDGGDELFGGYGRHVDVPRLWAKLRRVPAPLRANVGKVLGQIPAATWTQASRLLPGGRRPAHFGQNIRKGLAIMGSAQGVGDIHARFLDHWSDGSPVLGGDPAVASRVLQLPPLPGAPDAVAMMYADAMTYLPDDILTKVDRSAMAVSLEGRVPFLDHRVAAAAARVPLSMKIRDGRGKAILRDLLYREVPRTLIDRPKAGFAVPVGDWLRGPLRPWAEALLDRDRLTREGLFDAHRVNARWRAHLSGREDATAAIWSTLMFQAWNEQRLAANQGKRKVAVRPEACPVPAA